MNSRLISQEGPEVHSGHHFPWLFLLHSACSCLLSFSQLVEGKSILSVNQAQTLTVSITLLFFFSYLHPTQPQTCWPNLQSA